ncbi:mediator of RNA polymerase II transcription subunit 16-like [Tubulanus polymorphus]|uniref:mediator of RNA polymerase II transcription subunit 16-like n=1 Tax=Tubulanus polymorphus TaxID=672921 RepID=UPI003DA21DD6
MDLLYTVSKEGLDKRDWMTDECTAMSISCRNVVAFCSMQILGSAVIKQKSGGIGKKKGSYEVQFYLYVCDLDKPWDVFLVTNSDDTIDCLQWDPSGTRLLVAGGQGTVQVWIMKDFLLNDWCMESSASLKGEEFLAIAWLHTGVQHQFLADKRDSLFYTEKYTRVKFAPSVSQFGGGAAEGWIAVTATGLVSVGYINGSREVITKTEHLNKVRCQTANADIGFSDDGSIYVATTDGIVMSAVQFYRILLKFENSSITVTCRSHASFFCRSAQDSGAKMSDSKVSKVTHIKFLSSSVIDTAVVSCWNGSTTYLELWKLLECTTGLHKMFSSGNAANMNSEKKYSTKKWMHKLTLTYNSETVDLAMPNFPIVPQSSMDPTLNALQYIAVAFKDRTVKLIGKSSFQFMNNYAFENVMVSVKSETKKQKVLPSISTVHQTYTGCGIVTLDSYGSISIFRPISLRDPALQVSYLYIISLLEYCIITGFDYWDILLLMKPGAVEPSLQRLIENFKKQPQSVQESLFTRFMALKASLYRYSTGSQQKVSDCLSSLLLTSVATTFKNIIRPKQLVTQDKSPCEKLYVLCSKSQEPDLDQMLMTLETKEFIVGPGTLQSLQQLIQWVADFTLYLLASIPVYQNYANFPGSSIIHDSSYLVTLRELLIIIRMWGLVNSSCLPVFSTSSSVDCLSTMFKLLTKVWVSAKEGNSDFDDALVDECCLLHSQISVPNLEQIMIQDGKHLNTISAQQPVKFVYGDLPDHMTKPVSASLVLDGQSPAVGKRDSIRQIGLGVSPPERLKQCSRCGNISLIRAQVKSPDLKAWDQRWARFCMCGGQWKLVVNN